jgi:signal transduction histidine kinase/ActR/RegA family two-component response regulator
MRPQLGRLVAPPVLTVGAVAAGLVWGLEHIGSAALSLVAAGGGIVVCVLVAHQVRTRIHRLSEHYEDLLRTADEQSRRAEEANRLKDEFLATLSHELRTPLNSVLGWARLLAGGRLDAAQTRRAIVAIERAGWAQSRLVEDLLDISRIVNGKLRLAPRATLMPPLIELAVDSLRPAAAARRLTLETRIDPRIGVAAVDPDRFQQIVWNLVSNAIKFTPSGGRVTVRLDRDADHVRLLVEDTGIGFPPEVAAHLFERFRQGDSSTTREYGGLGLGLGIVRHVAELHGGTVTAESPGRGRGSTFTVRLPMGTGVQAPAAAPVGPQAPSLDGVSVLVVDDDVHALEYARSVLEQYGASVALAASAEEARTRYSSKPPDVLVADLLMPGEDGLQLIQAIRGLDAAGGRSTPAAALTALARMDDRRRALDAGYQMHVTKPIDPDELVATVERLARGGPEGGGDRLESPA